MVGLLCPAALGFLPDLSGCRDCTSGSETSPSGAIHLHLPDGRILLSGISAGYPGFRLSVFLPFLAFNDGFQCGANADGDIDAGTETEKKNGAGIIFAGSRTERLLKKRKNPAFIDKRKSLLASTPIILPFHPRH